MTLHDFIKTMPKVELHVHLEGATSPETLLKLAKRNNIALPADSVEGIREWYKFTDFENFLKIYFQICECIRSPDDIELLAREFLADRAAQNIVYSEVTYTPGTHYAQTAIPFAEQLAALNRASAWAEEELGVAMGIVVDISRHVTPQEGITVAEWAISGKDNGVVAFGLGGPEIGHPPEKFVEAFDLVRAAGLPSVPHAGEVAGPESIWGALNSLHADRIGHGVRCMEDPKMVDVLRERQIPIEVCPTSNICLKVFDKIEDHPLPRLLEEGLFVTLNSDDPPMFNTTLTDEFLIAVDVFGFDADKIKQLSLNAIHASFLPDAEKQRLESEFMDAFACI